MFREAVFLTNVKPMADEFCQELLRHNIRFQRKTLSDGNIHVEANMADIASAALRHEETCIPCLRRKKHTLN